MVDVAELIRRRRGQMLVHSCIYYEMNQNIISDHQWQDWANELRDLQNANPEISKNLGYYDTDFADWDGSTGNMLPIRTPEMYSKAKQLLRFHDQWELQNGKGRHAPVRSEGTLETFFS